MNERDAVMNMERKVAASNFVWDDPFLLEDQLSEDERMIRDAAAMLEDNVFDTSADSLVANEAELDMAMPANDADGNAQ